MRALSCVMLLLASSCVLPSFEKVSGHDAGVTGGDASTAQVCGLPNKLPRSCSTCIHDNCCDVAQDCAKDAACAKDALKAITPAVDFSAAFDPLLECMQRSCDDACEVSWGCVDNYAWPVPKKSYDVTIHVIDFAATPDKPLPGVTVDACQSIDPSCATGKVGSEVTDDNGDATLTLDTGFDGFFAFSGGGYVLSTAQFSEPLYRIAGFTQYGLTEDAVKFLALQTGVHQAFNDAFDPNLGHMIFRTQNCLPLRFLDQEAAPHAEAGGVRVRVDPDEGGSPIFYTDKSGLVSPSLDATTSNGFGGTFNLPAHNPRVTGVDAMSERPLESGTVAIRPATVGFMFLVPTARR